MVLCEPYVKNYSQISKLNWLNVFHSMEFYKGNKTFVFLNIEHRFKGDVDWNFSRHKKLWTYNLNYFEFLTQKKITEQEGLALIKEFISKYDSLKDAKESYPTSLRIINWVKFISIYQINDEIITKTIRKDINRLKKNLEYHLLGNHLLENAFALLFGSYYFSDEPIYNISKKLLESELNEQILNDGAHFELSPMYHQLILTRLLDCINLIDNNPWKEDGLIKIMQEKALKMLSWLHQITYLNGSIPLVNDSALGIAPCSEEIFDYAKMLKLKHHNSTLSDSGYRKWNDNQVEILMDIGQIGPDYIPGHAHADTFNFEFLYKKRPIIVDTAISTYEKNSKRQLERSTESHNTIRIDGKNSSDVWGGFRVGRRAKIISFKEEKNKIVATHDGYKRIGALHTRSFNRLGQKLIVEDIIDSKKSHQIESFLHLHPDCNISIDEDVITVDSEITIQFKNHRTLIVQAYDFPVGYNSTKKAYKIKTLAGKYSKIEITYES